MEVVIQPLLVGFSMCAFFPHPESPGDAAICFTIIFLAEFLSSVLYSPKRPRGLLKWLKAGKLIPLGKVFLYLFSLHLCSCVLGEKVCTLISTQHS